MRRFLYIMIVVLALSGCRDGNERAMRQLATVDTLLTHELVDSALNEISRIDTAAMNDEVRAYYALLRVQAMWKAYIPVASDSLLDFSLAYYEKNGPKELLARTYYYKGVIQKEQNRTSEAVESLKQAEFLADASGDLLLQSKVCNSLEDINFSAGEYDKALEYALRAVDCCSRLNNPKLLLEDYEALAVAYHHVGKKDSALYYFEQCVPLTAYVRKEEQAHVLANLGVYYKNMGGLQKAEELLKRSVEIEPHGFAYRSLASLYADRGDYVKAEEFYQQALAIAERLDTRISTLQGLRELKMQTGDYRSANEMAGDIAMLKDSLEKTRKAEDVASQQQSIDHRQVKKEMNANLRKSWYWSLSLLALLVAFAAYYFYRKRQDDMRMSRLQQQMAENAKSIEAARLDAEDVEGKMTELRRDHRKAKDQLFSMQQRVEQLQEKQDSTIEKMRTDYAQQLSHGRVLHDALMAGGTTQLWRKQDFLDFECYYCMRDIPFSIELNEGSAALSPQQRCCLILSHMGKSDEEIRTIMGMSEGAWRTMLSRMKKMTNKE